MGIQKEACELFPDIGHDLSTDFCENSWQTQAMA